MQKTSKGDALWHLILPVGLVVVLAQITIDYCKTVLPGDETTTYVYRTNDVDAKSIDSEGGVANMGYVRFM